MPKPGNYNSISKELVLDFVIICRDSCFRHLFVTQVKVVSALNRRTKFKLLLEAVSKSGSLVAKAQDDTSIVLLQIGLPKVVSRPRDLSIITGLGSWVGLG